MDPNSFAYRLTPGTEILRREKDTLIIKAQHAMVELQGDSATLFESEIARRLDGTRSVTDISREVGLADIGQLSGLLSELNRAGVVVRESSDAPGATQGNNLIGYCEATGVDPDHLRGQLQDMTVSIIGIGTLGNALGNLFAKTPLKKLRLVDSGDIRWQQDPAYNVAGSEQQNIQESHTGSKPRTIELVQNDTLEEAAILSICEQSDFIVSAFGQRFTAVNYRVNRAVHQTGTPTLFCSVGTAKSTVGPLVFPFETACFLCIKMRKFACDDDFEQSMELEERLSARRSALSPPPVEPEHLSYIIAGMAFAEVLNCILATGSKRLTDKITSYDPFNSGFREHHLLRRHDCPVCAKKKALTPPQPSLAEMIPQPPGHLQAHLHSLVDSDYGIIRKINRIHKDLSEPAIPLIFRAELSNHRFLEKGGNANLIASGKGFSEDAALTSALGEAIERYSSSNWDESRVLRGPMGALDCECLPPEDLVLFNADQYPHLKYDTYTPEASIGWVAMRALGTARKIAVPALAVLMAYETAAGEPFLFPITSNGLAAGPTLEQAVLSAAYEVIERDTFLYTWLNQLPCIRIDPLSIPDDQVRSMVLAHRRRGVELELYKAPTDHGVHVFIGIGVGNGRFSGPAAVVGLGANLDSRAAAISALTEICQVRPALRMRLRQADTQKRLQTLLHDPETVSELEDHDLLYADYRMLGHFDFVRSSPSGECNWLDAPPPEHRLQELVGRINRVGSDILYANLTSPDISTIGISVVRVVIPGFQPMHFGFKERRLAAKRLYQIPVTLGFRGSPSSPQILNPLPHPLA